MHFKSVLRHRLEEIHAVADFFADTRNFNYKFVAALAVADILRIKYNTAFLTIAVVVYIKSTVGLFFEKFHTLLSESLVSSYFNFFRV